VERANAFSRVGGRTKLSATCVPLLQVEFEVQRRDFAVKAAFDLEAGERLAIFGTSGAGKTTILESIAGLNELNAGHIRVEGTLVAGRSRHESPVAARHRRVALVRQPTTLFPHLSVEQNVAYGIRREPARRRVPELLERLGLSDLARARGAALSGGQRQRVALGRALASPFRVLAMDEPLSAVDLAARQDLRQLAIEMTDERDGVGILVTHALTEAQAFSDQLAIIDKGQVLQRGGALEVVLAPANRRVAELVGYKGFLGVPPSGDGSYAIHPDRVLLGMAPERGIVLDGTVLSTRPFGPRYESTVSEHNGGQFTVHLDEPLNPGTECKFTALHPPVVSH